MTNFDRIKNMSIEEMAERNVYAIRFWEGMSNGTVFRTSSGTYFETFDEAKKHEMIWLQRDMEQGLVFC